MKVCNICPATRRGPCVDTDGTEMASYHVGRVLAEVFAAPVAAYMRQRSTSSWRRPGGAS